VRVSASREKLQHPNPLTLVPPIKSGVARPLPFGESFHSFLAPSMTETCSVSGEVKRNRSRDAAAPEFCLFALLSNEGRRSADRRNLPLSAPRRRVLPLVGAAGAKARSSERARLSALHRGSRLGDRTPLLNLGPRFLESSDANGLLALSGASAASSSRTGRSAGRAGSRSRPGAGCESRPQAPHSLRRRIASRWRPSNE
jgi:hypothetical protein